MPSKNDNGQELKTDEKHELIAKGQPGILAVWSLRHAVWRFGGQWFNRFAIGKTVAYVKYADLVVKSKFSKVSVPLISINYIEIIECTPSCSCGATSALDVRGRGFRIKLKGYRDIDAMCEMLRFLVVRQRVPHSIRDLPPDWRIYSTMGSDENLQLINGAKL